jgi:hypothetical protein
VISRRELDQSVTWGTLTSAQVLKPPFSALPTAVVGGAKALAGCTACIAGTGGTRGVIRFESDGTIRLVTGASTKGVLLYLQNTRSGESATPKTIAIAAPAGVVKVF